MDADKIGQNRELFYRILKGTGRRGVDEVLSHLEELGFFTAPASTRFHGAEDGGLLQHSLNVWQEAGVIWRIQVGMRPEIETLVPEESIAIAALLHDVCKAEVYVREIKHRKNAQGRWEDYVGYGVDYSGFPMGHGEKSVIQLMKWGLELTDAEMLAIRWHMGAFNVPLHSAEEMNCLTKAKERHPLVAIISAADGLASYILETH